MKKLVAAGMVSVLLLTFMSLCYAGSIPEDLLGYDSSQVYFGEVVKIDGQRITVIQRQNIKGEFEEGNQITYSDYAFTESPRVGKVYLCGYFDENNPLYVWETIGMETKTLRIKNKDELSKRMEKYLNEGLFDKKEHQNIQSIESTVSSKTVQSSDLEDHKDYVSLIAVSLVLIALVVAIVVIMKKRQRKGTN